MTIDKLIIKNYKIFKDIEISMNDKINIFVGKNNSGKTTILDAINLLFTGKINGATIMQRLTTD
ncbi:AAA family ATPase [bacterium]|nr:AAA family ATPase [bacterium]